MVSDGVDKSLRNLLQYNQAFGLSIDESRLLLTGMNELKLDVTLDDISLAG